MRDCIAKFELGRAALALTVLVVGAGPGFAQYQWQTPRPTQRPAASGVTLRGQDPDPGRYGNVAPDDPQRLPPTAQAGAYPNSYSPPNPVVPNYAPAYGQNPVYGQPAPTLVPGSTFGPPPAGAGFASPNAVGPAAPGVLPGPGFVPGTPATPWGNPTVGNPGVGGPIGTGVRPESLPPPIESGLQGGLMTPAMPDPGLGGNFVQPTQPAIPVPIDVYVEETRTGRLMFGAGINSDAGVTGQVVVDERNFDLFRWPTSWEDFVNGTAFRGAGQSFRMEAMPGNRVQRYTISLGEPYLFDTQISSNISGFLFTRRYFDWSEERMGGRLAFGYRLTPDISVTVAGRAENVEVFNPRVVGVQQLDEVVGNNFIAGGKVSVIHDTRDIPFSPTEGHYIELSYEQIFGSFDYPRVELDYRKYLLLAEHPDGSQRHTMGFSSRIGVTGADTPIFENYFAGGYSTMRGFSFRGASPKVSTVTVGGQLQFLNSIEYFFPITADDMLRGVAFVDFGTVEETLKINKDNLRMAPGFGLRVAIPALGPAPLALDFAFPVFKADTDDTQVFSFFMGFGR